MTDQLTEPRPPGAAALLERLPLPARLGVLLAVVGLIGAVIVLVQRTDRGSAGGPATAETGVLDARAPARGEPAPDFALPDLNGAVVRLSDLRGRPVLINFWATWCGPCKREMPDIQHAYEQANGDLVVLAVNAEGTAPDLARRLAADFRDELGLTFPILLDSPDTAVLNQYRLTGMPDSFFIDRNGIVQDVVLGPLTKKSLEEKLSALQK
jgi:thiol-disulfide isomerase/thioredoxin